MKDAIDYRGRRMKDAIDYHKEISRVLSKYTHPQQAVSYEDMIRIQSLRIEQQCQNAIKTVNNPDVNRKAIRRIK